MRDIHDMDVGIDLQDDTLHDGDVVIVPAKIREQGDHTPRAHIALDLGSALIIMFRTR